MKSLEKDNKKNIGKLFSGYQREIIASLDKIRNIYHPGSKGTGTENKWIEWLSTYLPKRYSVNNAIVIDSKGNLSDQLDLVIYDNQYSPFILNENEIYYIPVESVYAVFEIKQKLDAKNIKYAMDKVASVRSLHRTSKSIRHAGGTYKGKEQKELHEIIGGIITFSSGYNTMVSKALKDRIHNTKGDGNPKGILNFGLSVEAGAFLNREEFKTCENENALLFFFFNLITELQNIGTVPAIDMYEYMKHIDL